MDHIGSLLQRQIERPPQSQWADLVGRFTTAYNASTEPRYRYTEARMAMRLAPVLKREGVEWLEWWYEDLRKKENFGRFMNWSLSAKNVKE